MSPGPAPGAAGETSEAGLRRELCHVGELLYEKGFVAGRAGNLSVRLPEGRILVTPRGSHLGRMRPEEAVSLRLDDPGPEAVEAATTELPTHRRLQADTEVAAVVHSHAPALTAAGIRGLHLDEALPEVEEAVGGVTVVPYAESGGRELAGSVVGAVRDGARLVVLRNHGVVAVGNTLAEGFDRTELAELAARTVLMAS